MPTLARALPAVAAVLISVSFIVVLMLEKDSELSTVNAHKIQFPSSKSTRTDGKPRSQQTELDKTTSHVEQTKTPLPQVQPSLIDYTTVPFPHGHLNSRLRDTMASTNSKIPNECITLVQMQNGMDWSGLDGKNFSELAVNKGGRASSVLSVVLMYLYAKRHGHGYRMINFEESKEKGKGVYMGSQRQNRHPAWSRIPFLSLLYEGGVGDDLVLGGGVGDETDTMKRCQNEDSWLLYVDTDVVVLSAAHSVGKIVEALTASGTYRTGLPCQHNHSSTSDQHAPSSWCREHASKLDQDLARGINPDDPVTVAAFKDGGDWGCHPRSFGFFDKEASFLWKETDKARNSTGEECPNAMQAHINTGVMLWRVPTRLRPASPTSSSSSSSSNVKTLDSQPSTSAAAKAATRRALSVGKEMTRTWRNVRIAPNATSSVTSTDYLSVGWFGGAAKQGAELYIPSANVLKCRTVNCGFASDQPVFNWAILYGLPQRPYFSTNVDNDGIGRFLPHISVFDCVSCFREGSYTSGTPFFHGTTWKFKQHHLLGWMLKLAYQLHGLDFAFSFMQSLSLRKDEVPKLNEFFDREDKQAGSLQSSTRFQNCQRSSLSTPCVDVEDHDNTVAVFNTAITKVRDHHYVTLRLSDKFNGIDETKQDPFHWYQLDWKPHSVDRS